MNRKLALLIGILAVFAIKMTAQDYKYGLYIGFNGSLMNKISTNMYYDDSEVFTKTIVNGPDTTYQVRYLPVDDAKVSSIAGITFGGYYEKNLAENIGIQFHLVYANYGYTLDGKVDQPNVTDEFSVEYAYKGELKMTNICAGIILKLDLPKESLSLHFGVTPSLCVRAQKNVERGALHKTINYNANDEYKPFNLCGTVGITYYFLENIMFSLNANIGLFDVLRVKEPYLEDPSDSEGRVLYRFADTKSPTNSVAITAGYRF